MMVKIEYLGGGGNKVNFETEIKIEELDEFLKLILATETQREVTNQSDFNTDKYTFWIQRGTYGDNFRGLIVIDGDSREEYTKIKKIVEAYHNRPLYGWEDE